MHVVQAFDNNVVLGLDEHGAEVVLLGRGLRFQTRQGVPVDAARAERTFVPSSTTSGD
jgi:beta-glucoside operon transcriptional antiterminator